MEQLLTPIQTKSAIESKTDISVANAKPLRTEEKETAVDSLEAVLEALTSKPDTKLLVKVLQWLSPDNHASSDFNIREPSPKAAQITFALVDHIVPDYWQIWSAEGAPNFSNQKHLLISCLRSVAGIGAIVSRLRLLTNQLKNSRVPADIQVAGKSQPLFELLDVLGNVIDGDKCIETIWKSIKACTRQSTQRFLQWKELLSLVASGKLLAAASEASLTISDDSLSTGRGTWVADGTLYASWLGNNIRHMIGKVPPVDVEGQKSMSQFLSKALNLGYKEQIVKATFLDLISGNEDLIEHYQTLINTLPTYEQKQVLYSLIGFLSKEKLMFELSRAGKRAPLEARAVQGVAAVIATLVEGNETLLASLVDWLIGVSAIAPAQSHLAHRAVIAVVGNKNEKVSKALRDCIQLFGDKLYIKHTPIVHQEVTTQILLILSGYLFRAEKKDLMESSRSSTYLNAISNRVAASSPRARFLGMVVGTTISELIDAEDKRMDFDQEELRSSAAMWYRELPNINDTIGSIKDLRTGPVKPNQPVAEAQKPVRRKENSPKATSATHSTSKIISIEEIKDSSDSEDDDLPMYQKPDSDPSDEDEDPTLVQRDKPTAPVYIRDLIAGLRDTENFDRHKLALTNAASLIRRKSAFGNEVSDNIEELATLLVGLSDKWEMGDFQKLRLQGMIAVLVAEPLKMGQWFSRTFYNGDYSMGQRASVLTTLGMGARELAGLGKEDAALTGAQQAAGATGGHTFPSKRLPDKLHRIYALEAAPMTALSSQLERAMIQPMAATAADQITGPNALKVRTFSSRMEVEKKRQKPIPNALAKVVAEGFFFPLTGRWPIHLQSYGEDSSLTSPFLLSHLLKTLSLILHASGTSTLSLPQMTSEFWDLLLSLRPRATDPAVLEALLFAFLTLLDINGNDQRRVAEEHAKELLETQGWVENVFERIGGGSEEGDRVRMLAAGVLMRSREVVEKYQRTLMGDLIDFM